MNVTDRINYNKRKVMELEERIKELTYALEEERKRSKNLGRWLDEKRKEYRENLDVITQKLSEIRAKNMLLMNRNWWQRLINTEI